MTTRVLRLVLLTASKFLVPILALRHVFDVRFSALGSSACNVTRLRGHLPNGGDRGVKLGRTTL